MKDIDLKSLRLFVSVCETGSLKDAALQEHIEPSAISKRLAQLESALDVQLLTRARAGARPTAEGQVLLEHARTVLFTMDRMEADLAAFKDGIQGHVRVAASASAIAESLLDDLAAFMRIPEHGRIQVDIEEKFSRDIVSMVKDGQAPLGVCWSNIDFQGLKHKLYRTDELVLAVPVGHPLASLESVLFEDTLNYEQVGLSPATAVYSMLQKAASRVGHRLSYRVVVSNFDSAIRVVSAGLGISVIPYQVGQIYSQIQQVATVKLLNPWAQRQFAICYRSDEDLSHASGRLLEFLTSRAADS